MMATSDVPGADPKNGDVLAMGCWAEHEDGSLVFVKSTEGGNIVYEIYDVIEEPPIMYQDAMPEAGFKRQFSYPPVGTSTDRWVWHDKTPFPFDRVMEAVERPRPQYASAAAQITAARRVARSLDLHASEVSSATHGHHREVVRARGRSITQRLGDALRTLRD
jgi:hypothetical protein